MFICSKMTKFDATYIAKSRFDTTIYSAPLTKNSWPCRCFYIKTSVCRSVLKFSLALQLRVDFCNRYITTCVFIYYTLLLHLFTCLICRTSLLPVAVLIVLLFLCVWHEHVSCNSACNDYSHVGCFGLTLRTRTSFLS